MEVYIPKVIQLLIAYAGNCTTKGPTTKHLHESHIKDWRAFKNSSMYNTAVILAISVMARILWDKVIKLSSENMMKFL